MPPRQKVGCQNFAGGEPASAPGLAPAHLLFCCGISENRWQQVCFFEKLPENSYIDIVPYKFTIFKTLFIFLYFFYSNILAEKNSKNSAIPRTKKYKSLETGSNATFEGLFRGDHHPICRFYSTIFKRKELTLQRFPLSSRTVPLQDRHGLS